jgi:hypothetical protein
MVGERDLVSGLDHRASTLIQTRSDVTGVKVRSNVEQTSENNNESGGM